MKKLNTIISCFLLFGLIFGLTSTTCKKTSNNAPSCTTNRNDGYYQTSIIDVLTSSPFYNQTIGSFNLTIDSVIHVGGSNCPADSVYVSLYISNSTNKTITFSYGFYFANLGSGVPCAPPVYNGSALIGPGGYLNVGMILASIINPNDFCYPQIGTVGNITYQP